MIIHTKQDYAQMRKLAYPSQADLADALYWQLKGDNTKMNDYIAKCDAVKAKFPKT
ncbi:MAG: hypothetical protein WC742_12635 [Gallionellaceae bacterium]|jgi:hypothetical protein